MTAAWLGLVLWLLAVAVWRWQATKAVIDNAPTNVSSSPAGVQDESGPSEPVPSAGLGRTTNHP